MRQNFVDAYLRNKMNMCYSASNHIDLLSHAGWMLEEGIVMDLLLVSHGIFPSVVLSPHTKPSSGFPAFLHRPIDDTQARTRLSPQPHVVYRAGF